MVLLEDAYNNYVHEIKKIMTNEQYEILLKYDCIKHFFRASFENAIISLSIEDLQYCFNNSTICKIVDGGKEIILSEEIPSLVMLIFSIEHNCEISHFSSIHKQYSTLGDIEIEESIFCCCEGKDNIFAIYFSKK